MTYVIDVKLADSFVLGIRENRHYLVEINDCSDAMGNGEDCVLCKFSAHASGELRSV